MKSDRSVGSVGSVRLFASLVLLSLCLPFAYSQDEPAAEEPEPQVCAIAMLDDQLFDDAKGFPAWCTEHNDTPRDELKAIAIEKMMEVRLEGKHALEEFTSAEDVEIVGWHYVVNMAHLHLPESKVKSLEEHDAVRFAFKMQIGQQRLFRPCGEQAKNDVSFPEVAQAKEEPKFDVGKRIVPWNLKKIGAKAVWEEHNITGQGVVIGLMDQPWNYNNPDLKSAVWHNPKEELNGKDDDENGFVDDLYGFNFFGDDGNCFFKEVSHALPCGGIVAGRGDSGTITGVAPRSKLMSLTVMVKGKGGGGHLPAMQYALENGADIISMSFMMNPNPAIRAMWRHLSENMTAAGILLVGGAGNFATNAKVPNQIRAPKDIPCVLCVAGVTQDMNVPKYSSRGPVTWEAVPAFADYPLPEGLQKPDVVAFPEGYPTQMPNGPDPKSRMRGNSFSGPHGAGVAALMLEAAPNLKPWQIIQILIETATDLGEEGWEADTGHGLINAKAAVDKLLAE